MNTLITRKIGMTSMISPEGVSYAVTLLAVSDNKVINFRTETKDGYEAVILGTETKKKPGKSITGQYEASKVDPCKILKEVRVSGEESSAYKLGDIVDISTFKEGDVVQVTGISKGKGFAGTVKRHNFAIGRKSHGGRNQRRPGSIGSMYPQKIFKGKRMAGHMGNLRTTIKGLKISYVDATNKIIAIKGAVPGPRKGLVVIRSEA